MPRLSALTVACSLSVGLSGCSLLGSSFEPSSTGPLAPPEAPGDVAGPLTVRITYPPVEDPVTPAGESAIKRVIEHYAVQSVDSTFIFGSVGRADADLSVNGLPVEVYPTGGWIAWLPLPDDSVVNFEIVATAECESTRVTVESPIAGWRRSHTTDVWIDTSSFSPTGDRWIRPDEGVRLSLRATPGADVSARTSTGDIIRFVPDTSPSPLSWGELAFATEVTAGVTRPVVTDRYVAWWTGRLGPDPDIVMAPDFMPEPSDSAWLEVEAVIGADTARAKWPLRLGLVDIDHPLLVVVNDDPGGTGATDGLLAGRPSPWGTYQWFFPNGTLARISGRWDDQVRLQLSSTSSAWVDRFGVYPLPPGTPPPTGIARSLRLTSGERSVILRIPLPARVPFHVEERERSLAVILYGVAADMDWIQYGGTDPFVDLIAFDQPKEDETVVSIELSRRVWGYRTRWSGNDLLVEIRRPPTIDPRRPLLGRKIAVDAGHPPGGATGPTGTPESLVTLQIATKLKELLERYGAEVVLVRESDTPMGLNERTGLAESADAEVMVSIHANALPDGVNPFENNGTSVYYFYPRSAGLARELNRALVRQLGSRDLGMGRGNLALVRTTWMPAALTEGLFMMLPDQEAVLVSDEGQRRYARGILEGLAMFLREWALEAN